MHEVYGWTEGQILMNYASIEVRQEDEEKARKKAEGRAN